MKFGSVDNIKKATIEELLDTQSIDKNQHKVFIITLMVIIKAKSLV